MYSVVFMVGGTDRNKWGEIVPKFRTMADARHYIEANSAFLGEQVRVLDSEKLKSTGLPVGYRAEDANAGHIDANGWWWRD